MINLSPNSIARWYQRLIEFHFYNGQYSVYCQGRLTNTWLDNNQLLGIVKITSVCRSEADWYGTNRHIPRPGKKSIFESVKPIKYTVKFAGNRWKCYEDNYSLYQRLFAEQIRIEKLLANKPLVFSTNTDKKIFEAELHRTIPPERKNFLSSGPGKVIVVERVDHSAPDKSKTTVQKIFDNLKNVIRKINL